LKKNRREQILEAALDTFARKGYHQTSIADIIEKAGIARGTFYLYFENKRQIFTTIVDGVLEELDRCVKTIQVGPAHPPPIDQLRDNLIRVLTLLIENPDLSRILLRYAVGLDEEADERLDPFYRGVTSRIETSLQTGIRMGLLRKCDTRVVAACIVGSLKEIIDTLPASASPEQISEEILQFGLRGVLRNNELPL